MSSSCIVKVKPVSHTWKCSRCGHALPRTGHVWQWRFRRWDKTHPAGYVYDNCADNRESGGDY